MQIVEDLAGDQSEPSLVRGVTGGHVIERWAPTGASGIAGEVTAVEGVVADVVQVLHVVGRML